MAKGTTSEQRAADAAEKPAEAKKEGGALTAAVVFSVEDIKKERLDIEEWGGYVIVHSLTSSAHEKLVQSCMRGTGKNRTMDMVGYQSKLAVLCARDDEGKRIFGDDHAAKLADKASGPISKIANKAQELSGFGEGAVEAAKENLEQTPSAGLPIA
jgi:hypothetical protein